MQIQGERNPHPPPLSVSFFLSRFQLSPISFSDLMPSLFLSLTPPRFAFQTGSPPQPPSQVCGPRVHSWRHDPSPPASFTCRGAAALILAPCLLPRRLAQTSSPSGLAQQAAACPSSASAAAELCQKGLPQHTEQWSGRVYRRGEKNKNKTQPKHFH